MEWDWVFTEKWITNSVSVLEAKLLALIFALKIKKLS